MFYMFFKKILVLLNRRVVYALAALVCAGLFIGLWVKFSQVDLVLKVAQAADVFMAGKLLAHVPAGESIELKAIRKDGQGLRIQYADGQQFEIDKLLLPGGKRLRITLPDKSMVFIPGNRFMMGSPDDEPERLAEEGPRHAVVVHSFFMARTAVSFAEYDAFCKATKHPRAHDPGWGRGNRPVVNVDWYDAIAYCNWKSDREGFSRVYLLAPTVHDPLNKSPDDQKRWLVVKNPHTDGYRLPTEAEWEYAARAGSQTIFYTGSNISTDQANYDGNLPYSNHSKGESRQQTLPVGSLPANPFGLHDIVGNVWQWCQDWDGPYTAGDVTNPEGARQGEKRSIRGGSWFDYARYLRSAYRLAAVPDFGNIDLGFRVVRSLYSLETR